MKLMYERVEAVGRYDLFASTYPTLEAVRSRRYVISTRNRPLKFDSLLAFVKVGTFSCQYQHKHFFRDSENQKWVFV